MQSVFIRAMLAIGALALAACGSAPAEPATPDLGVASGLSPSEAAERGRFRGPIAYVLAHREALALTPQQESAIQRIQTALQESNGPLIEEMRAALGIAEGERPRFRARELSPERRAELRTKLETVRPAMQQLRENRRAAWREVAAVLTAEQLRSLEGLRAATRNDDRGLRSRPHFAALRQEGGAP